MKKYITILGLLFFVIVIRIFYIAYTKHDYYNKLLKNKTDIKVLGLSAPRGRILDINGNVLVDNTSVNTIVYNKKNLSISEEIDLAYKLAECLSNIDIANKYELKKFYLASNNDGKELLTNKEYRLYDERKLSLYNLNKLKYDRVNDTMLSKYNDLDKKAAHIYYLMNKGYSYDKKVISTNVLDSEYAKIIENNFAGITGELTWVRKYNYGDTLKDIFGSIGPITIENKDEYLKKGRELNDIVGLSNLEYQYDDYLQGTKAIYKLNDDKTLTLQESAKKGKDLYLSIDINMQNDINEILKKDILYAKNSLNSKYYNGSYAVVLDSKTGEVKAMTGVALLDNYKNKNFIDTSYNLFNTSFTPGSIVKAASMTVAYQNNLVDIGKKIKDSCVKLYLNPTKCSYKSLGYIDDITALKTSSNYYQFLLAIKSTGNSYKYNMKLNVTKDNFDLYRNTFKEYGLGSVTGIDLPNEHIGLIGDKVAPDLLLNYVIGQYDTYTVLELAQYMNTVANDGIRYKLNLVNHIDNKKEYEAQILNEINLDKSYYERIKEGLRQVIFLGTGGGYTSTKYKPAGKTGTSESFLDSNNDGKNDVKTITSTYAMFAPYDDPKYTVVVVSPNVGYYTKNKGNMTYINRTISNDVTKLVFENY